MSAKIIDGKVIAQKMCDSIAAEVLQTAIRAGRKPGLAVILVGDDPASEIYVTSKARRTVAAGMRSFEHRLAADVSQDELLSLIDKLNNDDLIDGILVQLPLPVHIESNRVIEAIDPQKDVDGFHPLNAGRLMIGLPGLVACTPLGSLLLLQSVYKDLSGLSAVIIGRSNIVGKPLAQLLLRQHVTVTIAHSRTRDLPALCRTADILIAAIGRPELVRGDWIKPGATVIDVGINRLPPLTGERKGRLVGDVAFDEAKTIAGAITPVPGGVGPMTIACLLHNTLQAFKMRSGIT